MLAGKTVHDAELEVLRFVEREGRTYVHPYNDPAIIAGPAWARTLPCSDEFRGWLRSYEA